MALRIKFRIQISVLDTETLEDRDLEYSEQMGTLQPISLEDSQATIKLVDVITRHLVTTMRLEGKTV